MGTFFCAELYKLGKKKSSYIIPLLIGFLGMGMVLFITEDDISRSFILNNLEMVMIAACAILILVLTILSDDFSAATWKNYGAMDYNLKKVFLGKVVVQLINALFLFAFFMVVFLGAMYLMPLGKGYSSNLLIEAVVKIIVSVPCYITAILFMDVVFLKTKQLIIAVVVYYYGFVQCFFILLFIGAACENKIMRVLIMPFQLGYMYSNELSLDVLVLSLLSESIYMLGMFIIYKRAVKKMVNRMLGGYE